MILNSKNNESNKIDCCFLIVDNAKRSYQKLSDKYSAIEPPTWALLLSESIRSIGFKPSIIDANAEKLTKEQIYSRLNEISPRLVCFVVYGQNVNAGTTNMSGVVYIADFLKEKNLNIPMSIIGSHVQALPIETLKNEKSFDFVFRNSKK